METTATRESGAAHVLTLRAQSYASTAFGINGANEQRPADKPAVSLCW